MKDALQVLEDLRNDIHKEFERQDARADRRLEQGKCVAGADGQCDGLEKALKLIENKLRDLRIEAQNDTAVYMVNGTPIDKAVLRFAKVMEMLKASKRVRVDKNYLGLQIPTIRLTNELGATKTLELKCCESHEFKSYEIPVFNGVTEVSVVAYGLTSRCDKIEYIYANPQMNRLFAHLEDGRDVDYDLCILDVWWACAKEFETPEMRPVTLQFFKVHEDGHTETI